MNKSFGRGKPKFGGKKGGPPGGKKGGFGKQKTVVIPHRHEGIFIGKTQDKDILLTLNLAPGETVYGEKKITVEVLIFLIFRINHLIM